MSLRRRGLHGGAAGEVQDHPFDLTAALLPGCVPAEAARVGCGPLRIRVGAAD
ncbi:hypothetical protein [Streptomyces sp. NPDC093105]|uniref:hypothetical protein n=1 Tax=Streptomyces sp. NPDC093105 TaxID=3366029 RepID=UPI0038075BDB